MREGKVYTENEIQSVWRQFHNDPLSVAYSDDEGKTWKPVPSMDTGKWARFSLVNGKRIAWVYKRM